MRRLIRPPAAGASPCLILLAAAAVHGGAAHRAFAERVKWRYEAEVIDVKDPDGIFDSVSLGNAVFGTISYELTAASEEAAPGAMIYLLPPEYPTVTMSVAVGPDEILTFTLEIEAMWKQSFGVDDGADANGDLRSDGNDFLELQRQVASAATP